MNDYIKHLIDKKLSVHEALIKLEEISDTKDVQILLVMDGKTLVGTLTNGDIRRFLINGGNLDSQLDAVIRRDFNYVKHGCDNVQNIRNFRKIGVGLLPYINNNGELLSVINFKHKKTILPIDAVLMAGGKGERLLPLTESTPKPLLKISGKPIIDYIVDSIINYGVNSIHVTVNYLASQIEDHFKSSIQEVKINCVREKSFLGTMASVKIIDDFIYDDILVMNSDLITNIDFESFYLHYKESNADIAAAVVPYSVNVPFGIFEIEDNNILDIKEKPKFNYYANAGIYLVKKDLLDLIPSEKYFDAIDLINLLLSSNRKVIHYPLTGYWIDVGTMADYQKAQDIVKHVMEIS